MKLATPELKALIKLQCQHVFAWANTDTQSFIRDNEREALLEISARIYELIEELPAFPRTVKGN